jgi:hypothetical protein
LALLTDRKGALHGMSAPTRTQPIAQSLAQRIFEGQLVPVHKLDEQELAANCEVSRTPVPTPCSNSPAPRSTCCNIPPSFELY